MGVPSAAFKRVADATAHVWGDTLRGRANIAAGFTNSHAMSGAKLTTLTWFAICAAQQGMMWVGLDLYPGWATSDARSDDLNRIGSWLGAMAQSNGDQGAALAPHASDLCTAEHLGQRVARVTQRFKRAPAPIAKGHE